MPPKSSGTSYTGKPVRRLKLPKIGQTKTQSVFEEYFYILLAMAFLSVAILGKAGGFSTYNAVIVGAWITALIWFAHQWRSYLAEKSKRENEKTVTPPAGASGQTSKGPLPLPPGMKPMIGPQWPVRPGSRPVWPKSSKKKQPTTVTPAAPSPTPAVRGSADPAQPNQASETDSPEQTRRFVYERPTLPDRTPKLPNNWVNPDGKKAKNKKPKR
jgi:hypothetical protein